MKLCKKCGNQNEDTAKFCTVCGASMEDEPQNVPQNSQDNPAQSGQPYFQQEVYHDAFHQQPPQKEPVHQQSWFVILWLILFFPVGLVLMWTFKKTWKLPVKVIISAFFGICILVSLFGNSDDNKKNDESSVSIVTEATTTTKPATVKTKPTTTKAKPTVTTEAVAVTTEPAIEPATEDVNANMVLYEDATVRITYVGIEEGILGSDMNVKIENLSGKNITVQARDVSVNGVMVEPAFSSDIVSGKIANDNLTFYDLDDNGIEKIGTIELSFHVFDSDTWDTIVDTAPVTVVVDESAGATTAEGVVVYEADGVKITYVGKEISALSNDFNFVIENNMGKTITVQTRDVSVDGVMFDPAFSADVKNGTIANQSLSFWEDNFPETQSQIELSFHIFDEETWDTIVDTAPIIIDVSQ